MCISNLLQKLGHFPHKDNFERLLMCFQTVKVNYCKPSLNLQASIDSVVHYYQEGTSKKH